MLTLQRAGVAKITQLSTCDKSIDELLEKEWLLANERGGYASSTAICCNTTSYHGLLVGSLNPPVNRIMALANCLEIVVEAGKLYNLSTFEFSNKIAPIGYKYLEEFSQDIGVHFTYQLNKISVIKSIYLLRDNDTTVIEYNFTKVDTLVDFVLRPLVGLRDFHSLQRSYAPLCSKWVHKGLLIRHDLPGSCELYLRCPSMHFEKDPQWWFSFVHRKDKERGQPFTEDLWAPGFFKCHIDRPMGIVFYANLSHCCGHEHLANIEASDWKNVLRRHQTMVLNTANAKDETFKILCLGADQFVTQRQSGQSQRTTILAGFPWFADWGRDAFIALPGLLLETGRFEQARSVLTTFAGAADEGMIPNRFDDHTDTVHFNSVDASLWFINSAFQYLNTTGDLKTFTQELLPVIRWIIESYQEGTRFNIHADDDGLINAGSCDTQLTWMDAKYDGAAFTPRHGKAVEVNALWYNCLRLLAQFYLNRNDKDNHKDYGTMAEKVGTSFCQLFWNEQYRYLNDAIMPDGSVDATLRPNQIFAVSLTFTPPLSSEQKKSIVSVVKKELLTPYGLRTLNIQHLNYKKTYTGPMRDRDEAYHQGTVWPYLMGPFIEAYLKVNGYSRNSKQEAAEFIQPLMRHLTENACLGSISEIFDGSAPHKPKGCIAQAWSVAELLRVYKMIYA